MEIKLRPLRFFILSLLPILATAAPNFDNIIKSDMKQLEELREWIEAKNHVTVSKRGGSLSVSGDVRAKYITANEIRDGYRNIGRESYHPLVGDNKFGVAFNLLFDYRTDATWAVSKLKFDNTAGIFGGSENRIQLERAFLGFRLIDAEKFVIDLEPGRRKLDYAFDSRVQFDSYMDGLMVSYTQSSNNFGDFYIHGGPFVVFNVVPQFAYVGEIGVLNAFNTGLYGKYSLIDWDTKDYENPMLNIAFEFVVHQLLLGYKFIPPWINRMTIPYGAFLINSAARHHDYLHGHLANIAWYLGFSMGEAKKKGDWALDTNFQYVQPQSIPQFDFRGIGNGGTDNIGLDVLNPGQNRLISLGRTNFFGWQIEFLYLPTNNITVSQSFKISRSLHFLPTDYYYRQYRIEFIYAW
ncbi:MAG: hypothetical protein JSR76_07660 [Verrucomicrobia bacterium]|nr:hypothetical protein [Verrucomicrobiota bacterium]